MGHTVLSVLSSISFVIELSPSVGLRVRGGKEVDGLGGGGGGGEGGSRRNEVGPSRCYCERVCVCGYLRA